MPDVAPSRPVAVICGGVGAARMLGGLVQVVAAEDLTAIVNVGDDLILHGLHISPDLDTITYTLAGEINPDTGWGLRDESWQAMATVARYGGVSWFGLGDRDLGTHLYRTHRLSAGATLAEVTAEVTAAWDLPLRVLPVSNDPVRTRLTLAEGIEVGFQEYFVQRRHSVPVESLRFDGAERARPAPGVIEALDDAATIVVAPSNPLVSIDPVLAVPGIRSALRARRPDVVAVSPIVDGAALKGPADRLLSELGHEASVVGVARWCAPFASRLVIDQADADLAAAVAEAGVVPVVAATVMSSPERAAALATVVLAP